MSTIRVNNMTAVGGLLPTYALGHVVQVVHGTTNTQATIATDTFQPTNLTATITPKSANSKIVILVSQNFYATRATAILGHGLALLRNGTNIFVNSSYSGGYVYSAGAGSVELGGMTTLNYVDSPNTTGAVTYSTSGRVWATASSGTVNYQSGASYSTITLMEVAA